MSTKVDEALRDFERERTRRKLKISVKSNLMGAALQIPFAPVSPGKFTNVFVGCCLLVWEVIWDSCMVMLLSDHATRQQSRLQTADITTRQYCLQTLTGILLPCRWWLHAILQ